MSFNQLLEDTDDWLLGKKTGVSNSKSHGRFYFHWNKNYNKSSGGGGWGGSSTPLQKGFALRNLVSAALEHPEVMVKIPRRKGLSNGLRGIKNNLDYISRNGDLDLEDQDGNLISGKSEINELLLEYELLGVEEESDKREALNLVLSMPPHTNPVALKDAVREFAQEQFPDNRWVMVQHLDTDHPHCHLNILMRNRYGIRLNPRKNDLYIWRLRFAEKLRENGIQCTATRRQHRGKFTKTENGILRHIRQSTRQSYVYRERAKQLMTALENNQRPTSPFIEKQLQTQGVIKSEYGFIAKELYQLGYKKEAKLISQLKKKLETADTRSAMQIDFDKATLQSTANQGGVSLSKSQAKPKEKDKEIDI